MRYSVTSQRHIATPILFEQCRAQKNGAIPIIWMTPLRLCWYVTEDYFNALKIAVTRPSRNNIKRSPSIE